MKPNIIIDEVHNIGDPTRGPTLEMIITAARTVNPNVQIVALSATVSNYEELGEWKEVYPTTLVQLDHTILQILQLGIHFIIHDALVDTHCRPCNCRIPLRYNI